MFLSRSRDVGVTAYCGNSRINVEMEYLQSRFCCLNWVTMDTQDLAASISDVELHIGWILVPCPGTALLFSGRRANFVNSVGHLDAWIAV